MTDTQIAIGSRLWLAVVSFWKILLDGVFAGRVMAARAALPPATEREPTESPRPSAALPVEAATALRPALQLLALLQREGRFVDFVKQDIDGFSDAEIGAAARWVHRGCRQCLDAHVGIVPVRPEAEGAKVDIATDYDANAIKLTGDVGGTGPYSGTVRHRGWQVESIRLPELVGDPDARVLAPAEVEL